MNSIKLLIAITLLAFAGCSTGLQNNMNETIFTGGTVAAGPTQTAQKNQAIAVRDGVIVDIGSAAEVRSRHSGAKMIDAANATILPGLTDAHAHLYGLGQSLD